MKLMQLPNGTWLDPRAVISIQAVPRQFGPGGSAPPQVILILPAGMAALPCETMEEADALRDRLAGIVNEECKVS